VAAVRLTPQVGQENVFQMLVPLLLLLLLLLQQRKLVGMHDTDVVVGGGKDGMDTVLADVASRFLR